MAAVHRDEIAVREDEEAKVVSLANGDDAEIMQKGFRAIWADLSVRMPDVFDGLIPNHPTPAQMLAEKREAKIRLGFDPDRPVIGYVGRLVDEKIGRRTAFRDDNIRKLVSRGVQIVMYANVQADTQWMFDELQRLANEVNGKGPGRLVVRTGWNIPEQVLELLPEVDLGVVPSTRGTEASGFSETGFSRNGALILAPPGLNRTHSNAGDAI